MIMLSTMCFNLRKSSDQKKLLRNIYYYFSCIFPVLVLLSFIFVRNSVMLPVVTSVDFKCSHYCFNLNLACKGLLSAAMDETLPCGVDTTSMCSLTPHLIWYSLCTFNICAVFHNHYVVSQDSFFYL